LLARCSNVASYRVPPAPCTRDECQQLLGYAEPLEALFPAAGACRDVVLSREHGVFKQSSVSLRGFSVPATNTSVVFRFGSTARSRHACRACVRRTDASGAARCASANVCAAGSSTAVPSHMQLLTNVLRADAVVANFGLHVRANCCG
jgi:hypothetical protein